MKKFLTLVAGLQMIGAVMGVVSAEAGYFYCERSPGECIQMCRQVLRAPWARYDSEDERCELEMWLPVGCECLDWDEVQGGGDLDSGLSVREGL